jgi:alanine racemase
VVIKGLIDMGRPTKAFINTNALLHNLEQVSRKAPGKKIIAMVKANAYGCGLSSVIPVLNEKVYAFGVACIEEALAIRTLGSSTDCIVFQGVYSKDEYASMVENNIQTIIHQPYQLHWLLENPLKKAIKIWVKVNTGMHRLGFEPGSVYEVVKKLMDCPWVQPEIGLIAHFASADVPTAKTNQIQIHNFNNLKLPETKFIKSMANSAAIMQLPDALADAVRPGIMLYGVSPFSEQIGQELGLIPVMEFISAISAIHHYPKGVSVGYGGIWTTKKPSIIGVVAAGYGDGYPRHIQPNTKVWVNGQAVPIVGRVSMDTISIDLSDCPNVQIGDKVELWGKHIPVEKVANSAETIGYELLCHYSRRGHTTAVSSS